MTNTERAERKGFENNLKTLEREKAKGDWTRGELVGKK